MSLYAADRRHFTADIAARLYTPGPYYVAKTLGVLPFALANALVSGGPAWGGWTGRSAAAARSRGSAGPTAHPHHRNRPPAPPPRPQLCSLIVYGMAGLRLDTLSVVVNSVTGVLIYLISAQVQALAGESWVGRAPVAEACRPDGGGCRGQAHGAEPRLPGVAV
jgi:hypothetical protein